MVRSDLRAPPRSAHREISILPAPVVGNTGRQNSTGRLCGERGRDAGGSYQKCEGRGYHGGGYRTWIFRLVSILPAKSSHKRLVVRLRLIVSGGAGVVAVADPSAISGYNGPLPRGLGDWTARIKFPRLSCVRWASRRVIGRG